MRHPSEGVLRRLVDEPAGVPVDERDHVAQCGACTGTVGLLREDAALVQAALGHPAAPDVDAAWSRLAAATWTPERPAARRTGRVLELVRRPAVAALAVGAVMAGAGTAAATGWLPIFQTQRLTPVSLDAGDLVALPDLSAYGELRALDEPDLRSVTDAAAAERATGIDVPEVDALPRGVSGEPTYQVGSEVSAVFTFSADRAARAAEAEGEALPPLPPGLDGAEVRLEAGPGVAQLWTSDAGAPALVVGRAQAPEAFSTGVPFATVRDYVLSLPGVPEDVAAQLRTFTADAGTLPLPVPADAVATRTEQVDGLPATVLTTRDGALSAVVWVDEGVVTAVAGTLDPDEVLAVARGLR